MHRQRLRLCETLWDHRCPGSHGIVWALVHPRYSIDGLHSHTTSHHHPTDTACQRAPRVGDQPRCGREQKPPYGPAHRPSHQHRQPEPCAAACSSSGCMQKGIVMGGSARRVVPLLINIAARHWPTRWLCVAGLGNHAARVTSQGLRGRVRAETCSINVPLSH